MSRACTDDGKNSATPSLGAAPLPAKVAFLRDCHSYGTVDAPIVAHETHMSWVFLAGDRAYKLKKPVRFSYLDFSTLEKREMACLEELRLNRRLAPRIYLDVVSLRLSPTGLSFGQVGEAVDWLVVMRRLDKTMMLDEMILRHAVERGRIDRLAHVMAAFYRRARKVPMTEARWLARWRQALAGNRPVLFQDRFALPRPILLRIDRALRRFLRERRALFVRQIGKGAIVEGHGDLRPEHVWMGVPLAVIDCLEFNELLRIVDPLDEIAYFGVECHRLGAPSLARRMEMLLTRELGTGPAAELLAFYRCYRAILKARLALAHLLEPAPRTPAKWLPLAKRYLALADAEARRIELILTEPAVPGDTTWYPGDGLPRRSARHRKPPRSWRAGRLAVAAATRCR